MLRCSLTAEGRKPPSDLVREARRTLLREAQALGAHGEIAKAVGAYNSLKVAMECSRIYSAQGAEDQAALTLLDSACHHFEEQCVAAFDDLESWAIVEASGADMAKAQGGRRGGGVKTLLVVLSTVAARSSPSSLQETASDMTNSLGNILTIVGACSWTYVSAFLRTIHLAMGDFSSIDKAPN